LLMEVHFKPETEARFQELAVLSGRAPDDLIEEVVAAYLVILAETRETLDSRYDDIKSGRVKPIDGDEAMALMRRKSEARRAKG